MLIFHINAKNQTFQLKKHYINSKAACQCKKLLASRTIGKIGAV